MTGISSDLMSYYEFIRKNEGAPTDTYEAQASGTGPQGLQAHKSRGGSPIAQLNAQGYAAAGVGASSMNLADYREHSKIEQMYAGTTINIHPQGTTHQGQPIFGGYADGDQAGNMNTYVNTVFPNGMLERARLTDNDGDDIDLRPGFPIPPVHMDWQGYLRNFLDESAADTFANAKHSASKMVKQCSIFRSTTDPFTGGEGRDGTDPNGYTFGHGVRSLNLFDLNKLV